jgi:hypothetical protein
MPAEVKRFAALKALTWYRVRKGPMLPEPQHGNHIANK